MHDVAFSVLGPVDVRVGGHAVHLGGARQRALLAVLLLNGDSVVSVDRLVDEVWGETPPTSARTQVHTLVHRVRRALGEAGKLIETRPPGYVLRTDSAQVDVAQFMRQVGWARAAASREREAEAAELFRDALGLWRGQALEGVSAAFVAREVARLEELRLTVFEECIDIDLALGRHAAIVAELTALVAEHPLREGLRSQLMLALYRCGRQTEALEVYRNGRALLVEETGLEPGPRLRKLEQAILRDDPALRAPLPKPQPSPRRREPMRAEVAERPASSPAGLIHRLRRRSVAALAALMLLTVTGGESVESGSAGAGTGRQWVPGPEWVNAPPKELPATFFAVTVGSISGAMPGFRTGAVRFWDSRTRWANVQPQRDRFDWSILDRLVAGAGRERLPVTYTMGITPEWAAPDGPTSAYDDGSRSAPPRDLADWDLYVRAVVSRYKGRIHAYELWDFANTPEHYTGAFTTLATMTRRAAKIIKSVDAQATVVCPSMGNLWEPDGRGALSRFAELDGYRYCDAAAVKLHPHKEGGRPEDMVTLANMINNELHNAGVHLPMWATGPAHAVPTQDPLPEADANNFAVRYYLVGLYARYSRMYFYSWGVGNIPLVLQVDGSPPTRAARFIERLQTWLDGARIRSCGQGQADGLPVSVWQCRFQVTGPSGAVEEGAIRWTARGSAEMPIEPGAYRVDHLDDRVDSVRAGQPVLITERPILIRFR